MFVLKLSGIQIYIRVIPREFNQKKQIPTYFFPSFYTKSES